MAADNDDGPKHREGNCTCDRKQLRIIPYRNKNLYMVRKYVSLVSCKVDREKILYHLSQLFHIYMYKKVPRNTLFQKLYVILSKLEFFGSNSVSMCVYKRDSSQRCYNSSFSSLHRRYLQFQRCILIQEESKTHLNSCN